MNSIIQSLGCSQGSSSANSAAMHSGSHGKPERRLSLSCHTPRLTTPMPSKAKIAVPKNRG